MRERRKWTATSEWGSRPGKLLSYRGQASYQVQLGVSLDFITSELGKVNLEGFTETRYRAIAKYKNGFYSYYLPVAAAMYMARIDDEEAHQNALTIFDELGVLFQIQVISIGPAVTDFLILASSVWTPDLAPYQHNAQRFGKVAVWLEHTTITYTDKDDYEDCYGDPSAMGEMGTDIQENKCSWLVVEALKRATPEQRRILEENYGKNDMEKVQRVKQLYTELDLPTIYRKFAEESYQKLQTLISQQANGLPKAMFLDVARMVFKRQE